MTYLQDKKKKRDFYFKVAALVVAVGCFVLGATTIKKILAPIANGIFGTGGEVFSKVSSGVETGITTKSSLIKQVQELEIENQNLKTKEESYSIQEEELESLRQALGLAEEGSVRIFARVTSPRSVYGTFLLKTNKDQTVKEQENVIDIYGNALGIITKIDKDVVTVTGYDALENGVSVYLLDGEMNLDAVKLSRGVLVAKIPRETIVEVGDVAVISGTQIKLGNVVDFSKDEKDPFKEVYIRMSARVNNGNVVGIVSIK